MQIVEQHIINLNSPFYEECDNLCLKGKDLYNSCLYVIRQAYFNGDNVINQLHHLMKDTRQYKALPAKVSSSVLLMVQKNFKSFFKANSDFKKHPSKYKAKPRIPKYLDKDNGRFLVSYTNQAISKKVFKVANKIKLSNTNIEVSTNITDFNIINCVRIVPRLGYYVLEIVYTIKENDRLEDNGRYYAIDLGVNNLGTITSNDKDLKPLIINGKPLKSINQFYNKKLAYYKSQIDKRNQNKNTKRTNRLHLKRKNKIDNYLHKASKEIISLCKENDINTVIVGKNDNWKQEINNGKQNNQNFINIPHSRFIEMIKYKCEIDGINLIIREESYTSKASFLNLDHIPNYGDKNIQKFSGYRKTRGLYKIKGSDIMLNSDVNGSYNILRKAIPNVFSNGIEGFGVIPNVITLKK
jgi:putative transposase